MSDLKIDEFLDELDEEMTVTLELEDGPVVCSICTIFEANGKDYIALSPLDEEGNPIGDDVWIYGYSENPNDPNEEPDLRYISDDEEMEIAADKFDEYMDELQFEDN